MHFWQVQEMEIFQGEVLVRIFFSKLTHHMNRTFKTWGTSKSLQSVPYANAAKF